MKAPFLIGRIAFGGFFIYAGVQHFLEQEEHSKYAGAKKVPVPDLAVQVSGAALIAGGASIVLGVKPKLGAAALIGFLAAVSPMIHNFWADQDPGERMHNLIDFSKNLALAGGALALAGVEEPWPASVPVAQPGLLKRGKTAWRVLSA